MEYQVDQFSSLRRFEDGLQLRAATYWELHSFQMSGPYFVAVFFREVPPAKEPAVAAKVIPFPQPGGCVSVPEPACICGIERDPNCKKCFPVILNWTSCMVCDPEHAAAEHLCETHMKERLDSMTRAIAAMPPGRTGVGKLEFEHDRPQEYVEPTSWDHAPIAVNRHGRE